MRVVATRERTDPVVDSARWLVDPDRDDATEHRVTPLELFFDLVWVFAITQVTTLMSRHETWHGIGRRLLVLRALSGTERNRMARDSYSYLHILMVAGIVLIALGIKRTLAATGTALPTVIAVALCGGAALYLTGHVLFRLRNVHTLNKQRVVVAGLCLALIPLAASVPALVALGAVAALLCSLIAYEALRFAEARRRIHQAERA